MSEGWLSGKQINLTDRVSARSRALYTKSVKSRLDFLNKTLAERQRTLTRMEKYKPAPVTGKVKRDRNGRLTSEERIQAALRQFDKDYKKEKQQFTKRESMGIATTKRKIAIMKHRIRRLQKQGKIDKIL